MTRISTSAPSSPSSMTEARKIASPFLVQVSGRVRFAASSVITRMRLIVAMRPTRKGSVTST